MAEPAFLDRLRELHAAVRAWTDHLPQNLPYADLMFAFAHATLGDGARAAELVEAARREMEVPVPEQWPDQKQYEATVSAVSRNFLFRGFGYRIDQALAGTAHAGPLPAEAITARGTISARARAGGTNNPYLRAEYVITRMRECSRVLEPAERADVYELWYKHKASFEGGLAALYAVREPADLADRVRTLYREGAPGLEIRDSRFAVLGTALPLALRAGEAFAVELLELVPAVLGAFADEAAGRPPDASKRQAELVERAVYLAGELRRPDLVTSLLAFSEGFSRGKPDEVRCRFINRVAGQCLRTLHKLDLRGDLDLFLVLLRDEVLRGATVAELRDAYAARPERWADVLQTTLHLAAGYAATGHADRAEPIRSAGRDALLAPGAVRFAPRDYAEVASAYVASLGEGPRESGLAQVTELFRRMPRGAITNTWTTAQYYSRFHLHVVEAAVFAACRPGAESPRIARA